MYSPKAFIGCDPGDKGAICLLIPDEKIVTFMDNTASPLDLFQFIHEATLLYDLQMQMIEDVHSIFGVSARSNFNFGFNTGFMHGIFRATGVGLDLVKPKVWQKFIGVKPKEPSIKKAVAEIAHRLFPTAEIYGPKGGLLDGRSDALMIAYYCYQKHK